MRSGADYVRGLNDGRCVFLNGERVPDVGRHGAFKGAAASVAGLYEFQGRPENVERSTFETPTGVRVSRAWQMPTSYEELVRRREALVAWAELHHGFMGRSPDHVASTIACMAAGADVYRRLEGGRADAVLDYYAYARDRDLYLSYVIIDPQGDRSKGAGEGGNADVAARIVDEDEGGVTIRGAKMLGTGAALSDEVMVTTLRPLGPTEERYALTAMLPIAAKGVKLMSRRSYEQAATSPFDYPLSSRFDENDALIYFDDVKIPWDRIFVHRGIAAQLAQWHEAPVHAFQNYQAEIRLMVKLRFLVGLAHKIADAIGTSTMPNVRQTLGELAADVGMIEAFVYGMEAKGSFYGSYFLPDRGLLYAAQVKGQALYPRVIQTLRELSGGGVIMLPSSVEDFANPEVADLIGRTQHSPAFSPEERVQLFKLAWDAMGSEFASRHVQYETFYSGPRHVVAGMAYRTFDWAGAKGAVEGLFTSYGLPEPASDAPLMAVAG
ncbi:4-hydroxyphenylacetate 3-hydroxylase N-terminal domain-containing protein [Methylopila sp. 73B]|uniref:4-hydroxyphenylacetate 3-hydroxylase family protein n=1 Tax=Methylopila sp. 73B TaxID=1120792 RepID=UPI000378E116|nr:4-hydroxyphenylacetate 3-hydroxylase N-terminal domain-containing protein [Methylopila sp. 73B]